MLAEPTVVASASMNPSPVRVITVDTLAKNKVSMLPFKETAESPGHLDDTTWAVRRHVRLIFLLVLFYIYIAPAFILLALGGILSLLWKSRMVLEISPQSLDSHCGESWMGEISIWGELFPFKCWKELRTHLTPLLYSYTCYAVLCSWQNEMFLFGLLCSKYFDRDLSSSAVPIYTGPPVTQSASIISVITRQALASMRRMPEGIVWRTASTVLLLTGHMISDLQSTISGDTRSKYWPVSSGCQTFHRPAA